MLARNVMDFSIIIPTVGRDSLTRAVKSGLEQKTHCTFQVVVVNDSGKALAAADWQTDPSVRVIETPRVERSRARNAGAEIAEGAFFVFLDDDDWLLPDALAHFGEATSTGDWLLGDCQMLSPKGALLSTLSFPGEGNCALQATAGEWLPLQSMCIRRELFWKVGGFGAISLGEDRELAGRLALHADLKRLHAPISAVVQNARVSTSVYTTEQTQRYWELRDTLLDEPHAFARLKASAADAYWRGRLVRLYLNAAVLNVKRKRLTTALRRMGCAARVLFIYDAVRHAPDFWRGVLRAHTSHGQ